MHNRKGTRTVVKSTYLVFVTVIVLWTAAWLAKINLDVSFAWLTTGQGGFMYWTTAKIILWIIPSLWLLRISGRTVREVLNLENWRSWLGWGGGLGLLIALTGIIPNYLSGSPILPTEFSFSLLNVIVIAPTFEELLMRGAILGNLQQEYSFWTANIVTSLMFVVLHLPGWYFMGVPYSNLTQPVGGALSIFLVSLVFGYAAHRSRSVMGGVLSHFLNNLF